MRGQTHLPLGAAAGAMVAAPAVHYHWLGFSAALLLVAMSALAALFPDIDHAHSLAGRWIPQLLAPEVSQGPYRHGRRWLLIWVVWHRGPMHSPAAALLFAGLVTVLAVAALPLSLLTDSPPLHTFGLLVAQSALTLGGGTLIGCLSHLLADLVNPSKMPWAWPFSRTLMRPGWLPAVRESSWQGRFVEMAVYFPVAAVFLCVVVFVSQ